MHRQSWTHSVLAVTTPISESAKYLIHTQDHDFRKKHRNVRRMPSSVIVPWSSRGTMGMARHCFGNVVNVPQELGWKSQIEESFQPCSAERFGESSPGNSIT